MRLIALGWSHPTADPETAVLDVTTAFPSGAIMLFGLAAVPCPP